MPRRTAHDADVVWSSTGGDRRGRPGVSKAGPKAAPGGRVKIRRELAGRRGKPVTTIAGLPLGDAELRALASSLKRRCGVGGSVRDGVIELQGDHRPVVMAELRAAGYDAVLAGG
jgi:translation initiation factor 1